MDYYNEIDPYAAQWLRNLIAAGHIPAGVVDERSIEDVRPVELLSFRRCHFFAGIGVWALALVNAGWPDDRRVWTGSCPCQPFSAAGKGAAFDDERHLWPAWQHLIAQCRPSDIFGEQVASKDASTWLDLVQDDLEALGYAVGAVPFPAAGVGAPHIRDRLYWVGHADCRGWRQAGRDTSSDRAQRSERPGNWASDGGANGQLAWLGGPLGLADSSSARLEGGNAGTLGYERPTAERGSGVGALADDDSSRWRAGEQSLRLQRPDLHDVDGRGPLGGFWANADWLPCRDGKWRPVEPGTFPLAHGAPSRVGRLRAYGNAIVEPQAREFITAYLEAGY